MALPKKVKQGGSYFKGYQLTVNSAAGDYVLHISDTKDFMVSGINLIPDGSGSGDYITITHHSDTSGDTQLQEIGDTLYNAGDFVPIGLTFPAIEPFKTNEDLRITYTNAASIALALNVYVEFIR